MFDGLQAAGFQIRFLSHAEAILNGDFPEAVHELETVFLEQTIPVEEIVGSGGGETKGTQRLRRGLTERGWRKGAFTIVKTVNGEPRESISHEIDHIREFITPDGARHMLALEIEWNNKDPFFDRDLENFKRLHAEGAISVGFVVTRGASLQNELRMIVRRWIEEIGADDFQALAGHGVVPTPRQRHEVMTRVERAKSPISFRQAWVDQFIADKYGQATTHWRKLEDRIQRGVGNPCPLVLVGLPVSIVTFGEEQAVVNQLLDEGAAEPGERD